MKKFQPYPPYGHKEDKEAHSIKDFKILAKAIKQEKEMRQKD